MPEARGSKAQALAPGAPAGELSFADAKWLIACAAVNAVDSARLQAVANALVDALLDLQDFRRGDRDPRRRRNIEFAQRVLRAKRAGADVPTLCVRFNRSRAQIYRLMDLAARVSRHRETFQREIVGTDTFAGDLDARLR